MKCYFIDWTTNWADEMDITSAEVMNESEFDEFKKWVKKNKSKLKSGIEFGIGTNEDIDINYEMLKEVIDNAREITEMEYICFKSLFESPVFGDIYFEEIKWRFEDDEREDNEYDDYDESDELDEFEIDED